MKIYHVLYTASKKYFPHMLTSIYSLLENNKDLSFTIHIIEEGFEDEDRKLLERLLESYPMNNLKLYDMKKLYNIMKLYGILDSNNNALLNARLFASEIIDNVDKVLYLDSDTLVINSLKEILRKNIDEPVAAVRQSIVPKDMKDIVPNYYNSGVLIFNYEKYSTEDCLSEIYNVVNSSYFSAHPEQELLNLSFPDRILDLDISYNVTPYIYDLSKHKVLLSNFCRKNENYYTKKQILESLKTPHILHNLAYLNTRVWDNNNIHPFIGEYSYYRNLWDKDFKQEESTSILSKFPFLPYLNLVANTLFNDDIYNNVKKKVKENISQKNSHFNN